jgi:hypothetical protein
MPTLTPIVSAQPPNFGMGDTFSFLNVENDQNRTLFAKAVYLVNPGDISGGGGGGGSTQVTNTVGVSGGVTVTNTVGVSGGITIQNASSALNSSVLGLAGFVFTDNTAQVDGNFSTIQVISGTKFAGITATNSTFGNLSNYELPQGFVINGPITNYKLTYGAVLAYKV